MAREGSVERRAVTVTADDGLALYCETRGFGDPLLVVQGGISGAGATAALAERLAGEFLVISYDRRGLARSPAPANGSVDLSRHARDAATILASLTDRPAHVLGSSIGALIGLHLAVTYPDAVSTVVAHEPPMSAVVRDPAREAGLDRVASIAERDVVAAVREMGELIGGTGEREEDAEPGPVVGDPAADLRWFFRYDFPAVRASALTADRVAGLPARVRVVPTGGRLSRQGWEHRCALALADRIGRPLVELPGGHDALTTHPTGVGEVVPRLVAA